MVQPNIKIYPLPHINDDLYSKLQDQLKQLAEHTNTDIRFNVEKQFFDVKGRSQQACDEVMHQISQRLLPVLNNAVDEGRMAGTFATIPLSPTGEVCQSPSLDSPKVFRVTGKSLNIDAFDTPKPKAMVGTAPRLDDSDDDEDDDGDQGRNTPEFHETFTFSRNIRDPQEVLVGPPTKTMQTADYLKQVGMDTDTECSLIDRQIHIVGPVESDVKEAAQRFMNLQTLYKRRRRDTVVVPCVHYPTQSSPYGLYFCELDRYVHKSFACTTTDVLDKPYVLLPVFKDDAGRYQKPKDVIDMQNSAVSIVPPPPPGMTQPPQWGPNQSSQKLTEAMSMVAMRQQQQHPKQRNSRPPSSSSQQSQRARSPLAANNVIAMPQVAPDNIPLWGEGRGFGPQYAYDNAASFQPQQESSEDAFPALPTAPKKPTVNTPGKGMARRVMRISPQKSSTPSPTAMGGSLLEMAKEYNLHNMKSALEDGLEGIRAFPGEIKLSAKLGKVLWRSMSSEVQKKIWEFGDIKDIVVKEHGVRPVFSDMTTGFQDIMEQIADFLPSPCGRQAYFEVHAKARNQPVLPYKPVVMHVNQDIVEFKKIILRKDKVVEIDWVSLDRKLDFQMALTTQELGRMDVRPYSKFINKVSINPYTREMTYENVPDFLEVSHILHKQTTRYRIHFPFVVEITRIERVPLVPQPSIGLGAEKVLGATGRGKVWYDLEVYHTLHDEPFKSNLGLAAGKLASWTPETILEGTEQQASALVEYVRCLLLLVEKCESLL